MRSDAKSARASARKGGRGSEYDLGEGRLVRVSYGSACHHFSQIGAANPICVPAAR
jgi:hypothetical protein